METCTVYDDSRIPTVCLKYETIPSTSEVLDSLWTAPNSSPSFQGSGSMVNFEESGRENSTTKRPYLSQIDDDDDDSDECFHKPGKKRRLKPDQVHFLEKSFEVENKLDPDRKVQLAKELGLQPRQVAIWFQNRRARYKTKLLEKDYDSLKASYDKLKADYDSLFAENEKLKNEVQKLLLRENGKPKPEEALSSGRSDVLDSDSPHYTDGNVHLEPADSSTDEDDSLLRLSCFPKVEVECYDDLQPNPCNFGFPVQDQGTWFWQY